MTWWRRADVLVAAALLVLVGGLGLVWLGLSADRRHVVECANNLRQFHQALVAYADKNDNGRFPWVESQKPRNFAGSFVPALNEEHVLAPGLSVSCPGGQPRAPSPVTFADLDRMKPDEFHDTIRGVAGCYAYSLGYVDANNNYLGLTRAMDGRLPIMSDAPACRAGNDVSPGNSPNHGGKGQNVLYIDGHVEFRTNRAVGADGDDIFLNAEQRVAPGRGPRDTVLGRSDAMPYPAFDE
jgi:prepilin-type processing-associated H-X9-DG protein